MYIHNTTFMILHEREQEFIAWFKKKMPHLLCGLEYADAPRLSVLLEAGGTPHSESEAQSIAFQIGFETLDLAHDYADGPMAEVIVEFEKAFGPEAIAFTSIFRSL